MCIIIMRGMLLLLLFTLPLFARAQSTETPPTPKVTVTPFPTQTPVVTPAGGRKINIGNTIAESFPAGTTSAVYYFEGNAGQYVSISLEILLSYTKLQLLDDQGLELARGDFDGAAHRMEITAAQLPKDGTYTIALERSEGLNTFTLSLQNLLIQDITYGQVIDALLTIDQTAVLYRFRGSRFDVIDVSLLSTEFDPYVRLLDSSGHQIAGDDNDGGVRNAFFGLEYLWEDADYLIHVSSKNDLSIAEFHLRLNHAEFTPLHFGDSLEVHFTQDAPVAYFEFEGSIGDVVNLSVQSGGTLDILLQMADPEYMPGLTDDDSGGGFDPEITSWYVNKEGTYRLLLRPYLIGSQGQVTLILSRAILPSLDSGTQEIVLTEKNLIDAVSFTGRAGESVRLTITVDPLMDNPPQVAVIQNGQTLASTNGGRPTFTLDVTPPADGLVIVQVRNIKSGPGIVQLSLERVQID